MIREPDVPFARYAKQHGWRYIEEDRRHPDTGETFIARWLLREELLDGEFHEYKISVRRDEIEAGEDRWALVLEVASAGWTDYRNGVTAVWN